MRDRTHVSIMSEVYQGLGQAKTYAKQVERLRVLERLHQNCEQYHYNHSKLEHRLALHAALRDASIGGRCVVIESGMDCDCVQYTGKRHEIDANIKAFEALEESIAEWADGPFSLWPVTPEQAAEIRYASRDRALESYENGHPGYVVVPTDVDSDAPY